MKAITREWLARAEDDLAAARLLLAQEDLTNVVAFHAQQAVEKTLGLWDFAWLVHRDVDFSPQITQIALIFVFFRVNSRNSRLILARPCEILKSQDVESRDRGIASGSG